MEITFHTVLFPLNQLIIPPHTNIKCCHFICVASYYSTCGAIKKENNFCMLWYVYVYDDDDNIYCLLSDKNLFIFASNDYMFQLNCHHQAINSNMWQGNVIIFSVYISIFFFVAQQPHSDQTCLTVEMLRSYKVRHITFSWTPLDEGSAHHNRPLPDSTQHLQKTDIHAPIANQNCNPSEWEAIKLHLRRVYRD